MSKQDKVLHIETSKTTSADGVTEQQQTTRTVIVSQEPNYIKLYVNTLLAFKDLPKTMSSLLIELLKHMTFANREAKHGGQLIVLNPFVKQDIIERLEIKMNTLDQGLTKFIKSGILKRVGTGTYQANPHMFGMGEWTDIRAIRATFDFNTGDVEANITAEMPDSEQ
jgi:hypothetical protein